MQNGRIPVRKIQRKERIIEAASKLFSENNFHEVMMDDVAKLAGLAKGTLYNYFASKEDLYFSIMFTRMENLISSLKEKIKSEHTAVNALHSFVIHNYMFLLKYECFFLMLQKNNVIHSNIICDEYKLKRSELSRMLQGIIEKGAEERLFRSFDAAFAAELILGTIYAAVDRAIKNHPDESNVLREREDLFDFVFKGLSSGAGRLEDNLPLRNKNIVITRSIEDSKESLHDFKKLGANVIPFPTLEIEPPESWDSFDAVLPVIDEFDYLVFTSVNSVRMFKRRSREINAAIKFEKIKVIAVGKKTASVCETEGIPVNIIPKEFSGTGIVNELAGYNLVGKKIFIPSSAIARKELPEALRENGAEVVTAVVYQVGLPSAEVTRTAIEAINIQKPDMFIFSSPSTFRNFLEIMNISEPNKYFCSFLIGAIGPTTKEEIEKHLVRVDIMPEEYTMEALAKAAAAYFSDNRNIR